MHKKKRISIWRSSSLLSAGTEVFDYLKEKLASINYTLEIPNDLSEPFIARNNDKCLATLTFDPDSGIFNGDTEVEGVIGTVYKIPSGPEKEGYDFLSWEAENKEQFKPGDAYTIGQVSPDLDINDCKFTAIYSKVDEDNGDTSGEDNGDTSGEDNDDTTSNDKEQTSSEDGNKPSDEADGSEDDEKIKTAILTFKIEGAEDKLIEAKIGETIEIPAAPVKDGYDFLYWEGSKYYPGDKYKVVGDHVFTAVFKKKATGNAGGSTSTAKKPAKKPATNAGDGDNSNGSSDTPSNTNSGTNTGNSSNRQEDIFRRKTVGPTPKYGSDFTQVITVASAQNATADAKVAAANSGGGSAGAGGERGVQVKGFRNIAGDESTDAAAAKLAATYNEIKAAASETVQVSSKLPRTGETAQQVDTFTAVILASAAALLLVIKRKLK